MKNITTVNAANDAVRSFGEIVNAISTAEAKAAERIAEIKAKANDVTAPLEAELKRNLSSVRLRRHPIFSRA